MTISRREFLKTSGFTAAALLSACERDQSSLQYQAYLDHITNRGIGLLDGKVLRYIEFAPLEFENLNTRINTSLLVLGKDLDFEKVSVPEDNNAARMFVNIVNQVAASRQLTYKFGSVTLNFYSNRRYTEITFNPEVANALYSWISSSPTLKPSLYTGDIDQHVLIGKFAQNPLNPRLINSASASNTGENGIKTTVTVINTKADAQVFGTPDSALVTELMQGFLNSGGLLQEQQANSVSLAYQYTIKSP